ncbi:hypothetical protein LWI29_007271 [Acer saccharum]|uniref:RNA helicase n=1 Tax=Acer saccharum TaxID=4024 RepID=A0AA39RCJ0_ACESA|nr:hypothetical protein LWI29_007271 [Acer saccharum]
MKCFKPLHDPFLNFLQPMEIYVDDEAKLTLHGLVQLRTTLWNLPRALILLFRRLLLADLNSRRIMEISREFIHAARRALFRESEIAVNSASSFLPLRWFFPAVTSRASELEKNRKLNDLLDALDFNQVVIFVKSVSRAAELNKLLVECNFPSICIHSGMSQEERLTRYKGFKEGNKRILVATDLVGRGIDIERVDIVINYDMPDSADTYLHRVGRAGRFGTKGLAITFVSSASDSDILNQVQARFEVDIKELPEQIDTSTYMPSAHHSGELLNAMERQRHMRVVMFRTALLCVC